MAVLFRENMNRRTKWSLTSSGVVRTHTRSWKARTTDNENSQQVALAFSDAMSITLGDTHITDTAATVRDIETHQLEDTKYRYAVVVTYSTETPAPGVDDNPLNDPVQKSFRTDTIRVAVAKDLDGEPIIDTAGTPMLLEVDLEVPVYIFRRNEASFSSTLARQYINHVNNATFLGASDGNLLCKITADNDFRKGLEFVRVTYEFYENPFGWQASLLNQGLYKKVGDEREHIKDRQGNEITTPVPLDNDGEPIDPGDLPGAEVFLDFRVKGVANFGDLSLPT